MEERKKRVSGGKGGLNRGPDFSTALKKKASQAGAYTRAVVNCVVLLCLGSQSDLHGPLSAFLPVRRLQVARGRVGRLVTWSVSQSVRMGPAALYFSP